MASPTAIVAYLALFTAIGFAFLGSPQLLTRFMAARDQKQIIHGGFWAVLCVIGFDVGAVYVLLRREAQTSRRK